MKMEEGTSKMIIRNTEEEATAASKPDKPPNIPVPRFVQRSTPETANEYDFVGARKYMISPNTMCESVAHMVKVLLSGGVFAMHVAFSKVGVASGVIGLIFLALLVGSSMCSLVDSAQKMYGRVHLSRLSYPDLAEATLLLSPWCIFKKLSKCFRYTLEFLLMVHLLCTCAVFQTLIARALKQLIEGNIEDIHAGKFDMQQVYILGMVPFCLLVVMVRNLKNLAPFAVVIDLFANMAALVTIYYGAHGEIRIELPPTIQSLDGLFQFIGICLFSLQGISASLVIENNMAKPKNFDYVVLGSLPYATSIMMIIGVFGYWGFGDDVIAPITVHFPWTHFPIMTKMFLCIVLYISYAEVFYFGFDIQWYYLKTFYHISSWWYWERLYRGSNVIVITIVCYAFPNVSSLMGFLGCCSSLMCLVIPAVIELVINWEFPGTGPYHWRILKFLIMSTIGLAIFVAGTHSNLQ